MQTAKYQVQVLFDNMILVSTVMDEGRDYDTDNS